MTQWKLAEREHGARESVSRAAWGMMMLALALLLVATPADAAHPMRSRRMVLARQPDRLRIDRVSSRSDASRHATHSSGPGTENRSQQRGRAVRRKRDRSGPATIEQTRAEMHPAVRRRDVVAQRDGRRAPELRRVSARRRHGARSRFAEQEIARRDQGPAASAQSSAARGNTPLTVNDFVRAADKPATPVVAASAVYASGESHPDENVSESDATPAQMNPVRTNLPVAKAVVEAVPAKGDTAVALRELPSALGNARTRQELTAELEQPIVLPGLYRNGRLVVPPPLRGTREILVHQNLMADDEGLQRVQNDYDLRRMRASRQLVDFPESASLRVNPEMESDRRCARPWTVYFATDISRAFYARFHEPLQVNSAVRTVAYQVRLRRVNGNAAGVDGEAASPHLTGEALDFGKHGMSVQEIAWMRLYLLPLMDAGKLDVEEEFQQACFHISVYRTYEAGSRRRLDGRSEVAQLR